MGTMSTYLLRGCGLAAIVCLVCPFGLTGQWSVIVFLGTALLLGWLFRSKIGALFLSVQFVFYLLAVCAGLLMKLEFVWIIVGVTAALGCWDLAQFRPRLQTGTRTDLVLLLERRHVQCLTAPLALGLLLALMGVFLRVQLPFGWLVFIVLLALGSLYGFSRLVQQ